MKCVLANDHGAVELAKRILTHLEERGIEVKYLGVAEEISVDYPDKAKEASEEFFKGSYDFGILLCGTGIGISIAANKIKGIRCALLSDTYTAKMAKEHNNANMIALGGRVSYKEDPLKIIDSYLDASFLGGRHQRRIDKITALEN